MRIKKTTVRIIVRVVLVLLFGVSHAGCEYAVTGALTGVSMGIAYLYANVAEKTVCFDLDRMGRASELALRKMGISIYDQSSTERETKIRAKTEDLEITIRLKEITHESTKIKVNARHAIIKDRATALAIINQAVEVAETLPSKKQFEAAFTI